MESLPHLLKTSPCLFFLGRLSCGADTELLSKTDQKRKRGNAKSARAPAAEMAAQPQPPPLPPLHYHHRAAGRTAECSRQQSEPAVPCLPWPQAARPPCSLGHFPTRRAWSSHLHFRRSPQKPGSARPSPPQKNGQLLKHWLV